VILVLCYNSAMPFARVGGRSAPKRRSSWRSVSLALAFVSAHSLASCGGNGTNGEPSGVSDDRGGAGPTGIFGSFAGHLGSAATASGGRAQPGGGGQAPRPISSPTGGTGSSVGGAGPKPGFTCFGTEQCSAGERCVACYLGTITLGRCAPNPQQDPAGYQAATSGCVDADANYSDCDGPEDCSEGDYCVVAAGREGGRCQADAAPEPTSCCFSCDAPPVCTLCWIDNDCPMGFLCTPTDGAPNDVGGCRPAE
jgi:hypothetical protein